MGTAIGIACIFIFMLAWAACGAAGAYDDWSEYDDPFMDPYSAEDFSDDLTELEAAELILTEAELLESDADGDDDRDFNQKVRRLVIAMRMGAEALERSLEC